MNIPILTALREAKVDSESCVVEGIILTAGVSENGTYYPADVVESAAPVFRKVQCYADHPKPGEVERSVRDVVGAIEDTWAEDGRIRARIRLSRAHDWLLTMIEEGLLGDLSINAMGRTKVARRDGRVVREVLEITRAHSVDFVARGAAGGHVERVIRESAAYCEGLRLIERATTRELLDARPDILEAAREIARAELVSDGMTPSAEVSRLEAELEQRRLALWRESTARRLIDSSRLPAKACEYLLSEALAMTAVPENCYEEKVQDLIDRHRKYLASLSELGIIRSMGSEKEESACVCRRRETREFILKGRC